MTIHKLLPLFLLPILLYAEDNASLFQEYLSINTEVSYTNQYRQIDASSDIIESSVYPVLSATIEMIVLPKSYNFKFSYTKDIINKVDSDLYNPKNYDDTTSFLEVSLIPYYDKEYGGLGIFYTKAQQNSKYTNKTNTPIPINSYDGLGLLPVANDLPTGKSYQSKEEVSYLGVKYMLPTYEYLPKGANIYYSQMDRKTVYYATIANNNHLIEVSGQGNLYGFGLQRELHDIKMDTLTLDLIQFSKGSFSAFPQLQLYETSIGGVYKSKDFYIKAFALIYIAKEFNYQFNPSVSLRIPKMTDTLFSLKVGTSF